MNISFNNNSDNFTLDKEKNTFEWSYFELEWKDKNDFYSLVIIGFNGSPFTTSFYENSHKPTVNIVFFKNNVLQSFTLNDYKNIEFSDDILKVGDFFNIKYNKNGERRVFFKLKDIKNQSIEANLTFIPLKIIESEDLDIADTKDFLKWGISALNYEVTGNLLLENDSLDIKTLGYHDYNSGDSRYLYSKINEWCWWKYNSIESSGIFFSLNENNINENILIYSQNKNINIVKNILIKQSYKRTNLLLKYPNKIQLQSLYTLNTKKSIDFSYPFGNIEFSGLLYTRRNANILDLKDNLEYSGTMEFIRPKMMNSRIRRYIMNYGLKNYGK